ncbi:FliH/SctL family protein [Nesterenkonia sp. Act20]|uniref:FliH/SctL family protein n=1 Tax=Nesterenkonia sp. Act20 TaxID=1483432 RepID=UPI001C43BA2B|nr:FliH/SctL family protein [Nesterenkonia sp. Act20]
MSSETTRTAEEPPVSLLDFGNYGGPGPTDAIYAGAKTHGYAAGYAAGMRAAAEAARRQRERIQAAAETAQQEAAAEVLAATAALRGAAQAFHREVAPVVTSVETILVEAGLELAEEIVGTELLHGEHSAQAALARVLGHLEPADVSRVRMHPQTADQLPEGAAAQAGVRIVPDAQLRPGDAVADLPEGFLDARIGAALQRCREALLAHRAQQDHESQAHQVREGQGR